MLLIMAIVAVRIIIEIIEQMSKKSRIPHYSWRGSSNSIKESTGFSFIICIFLSFALSYIKTGTIIDMKKPARCIAFTVLGMSALASIWIGENLIVARHNDTQIENYNTRMDKSLSALMQAQTVEQMQHALTFYQMAYNAKPELWTMATPGQDGKIENHIIARPLNSKSVDQMIEKEVQPPSPEKLRVQFEKNLSQWERENMKKYYPKV